VAVKFVIARDGSVQLAQDGGSDMPDQNVVQCVARSFMSLSFPSPDGGIVTVVYPLVFTPE
jgi:outer membrane biosynthesis protein TonB